MPLAIANRTRPCRAFARPCLACAQHIVYVLRLSIVDVDGIVIVRFTPGTGEVSTHP